VRRVRSQVPDTVAAALNDNLSELLKRHPYHGVLFFAARCLCSLAAHHPAAAATLLTLLRRFVTLLEASLPKLHEPKRQQHARRGLFVVGQVPPHPTPRMGWLNWLFPDLNFFDSALCLMVRRWRLIGHFPILYNPTDGC
jgi:hypothetical protein